MRIIFGLATALLLSSLTPSLADETACRSHYKIKSGMAGEVPGSLATAMNTPCQLSRHIKGSSSGGILIVEPPQHGRVEVRNQTNLRYAPSTGYTGADTMLVRMLYGKGNQGALVRFAINVQ